MMDNKPCAGDTSGHFVERAIPAEPDHDVNSTARCILGETNGVPATVGLDDLDLVPLGERTVDDDGVARRHRRGKCIDNHQDAQDRERYRTCS